MTLPDDSSRFRAPLEAVLGACFTTGNEVLPLQNGVQVFPALLAAVREAQRSIDMLWHQWGHGPVTDEVTAALAARAAAGVRVRVLLDAYGARGMAPGQVQQLREAGCAVRFYRPLPSLRPTVWNLRTHSRILVCDETVGLTGGVAVDQAWTGDARDETQWRDTAARVRGPAVSGLRGAFLSAWVQTALPLLSDADTFPALAPAGGSAVQVVQATSQPGWNASARLLLALLALAQRRVRVSTPYVRLSSPVIAAIGAAAERGVQVQVMVPGPHVQLRSVHWQSERCYDRLLAAGAELWCYQPSMLHAKTVTVDGQLAVIGTANLDARSLTQNEQIGLVVDDRQVTAEVDARLEQDLAASRQLTLQEWRRRPVVQRARDLAADVALRPLLGWGTHGLSARSPGPGSGLASRWSGAPS